MQKREDIQPVEKNRHVKVETNEPQKIDEQNMNEAEIKQIVDVLIEENQHLLLEITNLSKHRKNKNAITPQMSLLTNKLERNLIRIARFLPPATLGDPKHVKQEKQRFLKFYRGRNPPKKNLNSQSGSNGSSGTPAKIIKEQSKELKKQ